MKKNCGLLRSIIKKAGKIFTLSLLIICLCAGLSGCGSGSISVTVSILGNNLSDLTKADLERAVEKIVDQNPLEENIVISFMGGEYVVTPESVSAEYDVEKISEDAFEAGSRSLFGRIFGSDETVEIPLSLKYDENALKEQSRLASEALSREAADFTYTVEDDGIRVLKGSGACTADRQEIYDLIAENLSKCDFSAIEMKSKTEFAEIDFDNLKSELDRPAKNPRLDLENDPSGGTILPGERGIEVDIEVAKAAYEQSGDEAEFFFPVKFTEPSISMAQFKANLFKDVLSSKTSSFNASLVGRTTNVKLACDFCNGIILNPGDEFSYNGAVGPRTYQRGFKDATVYVAGTTEEGVGGGICQVSSTIYSAALHADLKITERYNHSYIITYVPLGEDATVVYGSKDFKFVNNTDYPIKLSVTYGKSTMTVSIIGTNVSNKTVKMSTKTLSTTPFEVVYKTDTSLPVGTTKVKNNGYTGYVTETYRMVYENGQLVSNTFESKSVYKKLDKVILENPAPETSEPADGEAQIPGDEGSGTPDSETIPPSGQDTNPETGENGNEPSGGEANGDIQPPEENNPSSGEGQVDPELPTADNP